MLQFQCPHCDAVIRVQNTAMGQSGTCQTCGQKILVPTLEVITDQDDTEVIQLKDIPIENEPSDNTPTDDQAVGDLLAALSAPEVKPTYEDPILNVTKRGRRSNNSFLITGLLFLLIGGCGAIAFYYLSQPVMQAEFTAQVVPVDSIKPTLLSRAAIQQPELFESFWLKHPGKKIEINSRLLETSILAQKRGLELRLYPGPENDLYRVDILENKLLHEYYAMHSTELEKQRKEVLLDATNAFLEQMTVKENLLRKNSHLLIAIRDRMVLTAMVDGLGFRLIADINGKQHPCVWQDKKDRLYFALPKGTTNFIIRETNIAGQNKAFPNTMRFEISCPQAQKTNPKESQPEPLISKENKKEEEREGKENAPQKNPDKKDDSKGEEQEKKGPGEAEPDNTPQSKMIPEK